MSSSRRDGVWDREEIEAVYGVHHFYSRKQSAVRLQPLAHQTRYQSRPQDGNEHQKKADHIVNTVLALCDKNGDGRISLPELKAVGLDGLPNFEDLGAEGHHYDIESGTSPCTTPVLRLIIPLQNSSFITKVRFSDSCWIRILTKRYRAISLDAGNTDR